MSRVITSSKDVPNLNFEGHHVFKRRAQPQLRGSSPLQKAFFAQCRGSSPLQKTFLARSRGCPPLQKTSHPRRRGSANPEALAFTNNVRSKRWRWIARRHERKAAQKAGSELSSRLMPSSVMWLTQRLNHSRQQRRALPNNGKASGGALQGERMKRARSVRPWGERTDSG